MINYDNFIIYYCFIIDHTVSCCRLFGYFYINYYAYKVVCSIAGYKYSYIIGKEVLVGYKRCYIIYSYN